MIKLSALKANVGIKVVGVLTSAAREALSALLAIPLLLLLGLVLLQYGNTAINAIGINGVYSIAGLALALVVGVGLLFLMVIQRKSSFNPKIFLPCSLALAAVIYWIYISSVEVVWVSDFGTMWAHAVNMVASGSYTVTSIYDVRALPVLVPLILLVGPNTAAVPIVNAFFLLGIQLAGYDLARRAVGHRAAQGFTVLWIGAMEPILALPITSHDIWGLFFLVIFLWGFRATLDYLGSCRLSMWGGKLAIAGRALGMAAALTLLEMQREITPIVFLGIVFGGLLLAMKKDAEARRPIRSMAQLAVAVFILYGGMSIGLKHSHLMLTAAQGRDIAQIRVGAYGSSLSNGSYAQGQVIQKEFFSKMQDGARQDLVDAVPLSDLSLQPIARLGNIIFRAPGQALLGSQTDFYQAHAKVKSARLLPLTRAYNVCYSILIAALSLWLIVPLLRHGSLDGLLQLAILSALVGVLLICGESQPRYVFPVWFILPQLIVFAAAMRMPGAGERLPVTSVWGWDLTRGVLILFAAYVVIALLTRYIYGESRGRILSGWQPSSSDTVNQTPQAWFKASQKLSASGIRRESNDRRAFGFGALALVLKIPPAVPAGGGISADKKLCAGTNRRALDFFYATPEQRPTAKDAFTLEMFVDGRQRWSVQLPGAAEIEHIRIPDLLAANSCVNLKFTLRANRDLSSPAVVDASQTDLYFMRLVQ